MSLIKDYLLTQMNNELFDPGIDNLPMPVDGIEPDLEMLTQREQLMEDIDTICDEFFFVNYLVTITLTRNLTHFFFR